MLKSGGAVLEEPYTRALILVHVVDALPTMYSLVGAVVMWPRA
jgi:hypothetical protein